jgi:arginase
MRLAAIEVAYDSGLAGTRMGAGPGHLLSRGLESTLHGLGHDVRVIPVRARTEPTTEIVTAFELDDLIGRCVRECAQRDEFPIILSGNCSNACVGAIAGSAADGLGILWLDGHLDFDTPETTREGSLDAMALAIATGQCWRTMAGAIEGFAPLPVSNVVHVGSRAGPEAVARLQAAGGTVVGANALRADHPVGAVASALNALSARVRHLYVHLDLDVLDPDLVGPANEFVKPDGLSVDDVRQVIALVGDRFTVVALGLTCYDPSYDRDDRVLAAALELVKAVMAT